MKTFMTAAVLFAVTVGSLLPFERTANASDTRAREFEVAIHNATRFYLDYQIWDGGRWMERWLEPGSQGIEENFAGPITVRVQVVPGSYKVHKLQRGKAYVFRASKDGRSLGLYLDESPRR